MPRSEPKSGSRPARLLGLCLALLFAGFLHAASQSGNLRPRPNILLIISDDQAWTDYGFMGHTRVRTPNLDRLAAQSLFFPHGYVTASLCCPSLASVITGRYPHEHGIVCNDPPLPAQLTGVARYQSAEYRAGRAQLNALMDRQPTLPRLLSQAGYLTLQTGKWWQGNFRHGGFTHGMTRGEEASNGRHGDEGLDIGRKTLQPITDFLDEAQRADQPFLIWYAPMMPHDPHTPPERILRHYRPQTNSEPVARYWGMIEWFDETCGQVLAELDRRGLSDNTIVVFLADNGWIQSPQEPRFAPRSKQSPYDGGLRTPMLLRWPSRVKPARNASLVSSIDLLPTLLHAAQVPVPQGCAGVDWLDGRALRQRRAVQGACFTHDAVDLEHPAYGLRWRWRVEGAWKVILPSPRQEPLGQPELYHLRSDPTEQHNLAKENPRQLRRLSRALDAWWNPELR